MTNNTDLVPNLKDIEPKDHTTSEIMGLINDLTDKNVNDSEYEKFSGDVRRAISIINSQIDKNTNDFRQFKSRHDELQRMDHIQELLSDGKFAPIDLYNYAKQSLISAKEVIQWNVLQITLLSLLEDKAKVIVGSLKGLQIQSQVLSQFREIDIERNKAFTEALNDRIGVLEEKHLTLFKSILNDLMGQFETLVSKHERLVMVMNNSYRDVVSNVAKLQNDHSVLDVGDELVSRGRTDLDRVNVEFDSKQKYSGGVLKRKKKATEHKFVDKTSNDDDVSVISEGEDIVPSAESGVADEEINKFGEL